MRKLTKAQIQKLLSAPGPDFNFDYSGADYEKAYNDREYRDAVTDYNHVLPALNWHIKTGNLGTYNKFQISIHKVLTVKRHLYKILDGVK